MLHVYKTMINMVSATQARESRLRALTDWASLNLDFSLSDNLLYNGLIDQIQTQYGLQYAVAKDYARIVLLRVRGKHPAPDLREKSERAGLTIAKEISNFKKGDVAFIDESKEE